MKTNFTIRQEESKDFFIVENLVREAFWNVYQPGCDEHFIVNQYRDNSDFIKELSLVLELDNKIIGYIMFSKAQIDCDNGTKLDVVTFGPLAIHPDFQRKGFGKILVDYSLEKAKDLGYTCVFICGNGEFYGRSGFVPATTKGIRYADDPEGEALYFLCKELKENFLKDVYGIYHDPKGYFIPHEKPEAFEKYESTFPKKEKLKLPG
ncbi:MAG: N-acetyltransferase, partial [Spirochaetaceae bacterium]|nr:N-acetyltransferase [Spirochaetaceae bacterium]